MLKLEVLCGEPLCKARFEAELSLPKPWPVVCPTCQRALYPDDILQNSTLDFLAPHPGPLLLWNGGRPRMVLSTELTAVLSRASAPKPTTVSSIRGEAGERPARPWSKIVLVASGAAVLLALALWWFMHGR